ncbi:unnamed protein product [Polarella glacialis]|uniref:Anoctamin transmembrane domain-containing protein n=2 Tax=Polarella glacialis TaxID=89957 RepID=A0A813ILS4_POLGL|nr:unnamed protein product [Polarella glacialis]
MAKVTRLLNGQSGDNFPIMGQAPLLPDMDIVLDDAGASYVVVFPRGVGVGGTVDLLAEVEDPLEKCRKVFKDRKTAHIDLSDEGFGTFAHGSPVSMPVFQQVVREQFMHVAQVCGLKAESFLSIDEDEVFVKISLDRDGQVIRNFAEKVQYKVPLKSEAYEGEEALGTYPGNEPMRTSHGRAVPAYHAYTKDLDDKLEPFRQVDEIRLIEKCLSEYLDLKNLVEAGVASACFPAANHEQVMELFSEWGSPKKILQLPNSHHDDKVRDYFGEDIAFFFKWYAFYIRMLVPLAVLGAVAFLRRVPQFEASLVTQRLIQIAFGFIVICWSSVFNKMYTRLSASTAQRWGMKDFESSAIDRSAYDPHLNGSWTLAGRQLFASTFTVLYVLIFFGIITYLTLADISDDSNRGEELISQARAVIGISKEYMISLITAALISVFSYVWSKFAPWLTDLRNHRTLGRWEHSLVLTVAPVKLYFALYPFLVLAFAKRYFMPTCSTTLPDAAHKAYEDLDWPSGVESPVYNQVDGKWETNASLTFLSHHSFVKPDGQHCVYGCVPQECFAVGGMFQCATDCEDQLEKNLKFFFGQKCISAIIFMIMPPIILSWWEVRKEVSKKQKGGSSSHYSLLQLQAKSPAYEYNSGGGSKTDDFMEPAIGFAVLTCFSIALPVMAVPALFFNIVQYRLMAFRMTAVTRRPSPRGAEGIGSWMTIFQAISLLAVATNVGMAVVAMWPIREMPQFHELIYFIVLEHIFLSARAFIHENIDAQPEDVRLIEDFNTRFLAKLRWMTGGSEVPQSQMPHNKVDLGLGPVRGDMHSDDEQAFLGGCFRRSQDDSGSGEES